MNNGKSEEKIKVKKPKCDFCNKKLKLVHYDCDCGGKFCEKHRLLQSHNCKNYQEKIRKRKELLKLNNPVIEFKKLIMI